MIIKNEKTNLDLESEANKSTEGNNERINKIATLETQNLRLNTELNKLIGQLVEYDKLKTEKQNLELELENVMSNSVNYKMSIEEKDLKIKQLDDKVENINTT